MSLSALQIAQSCRNFAEDKKATEVVVLDLREVSALTDYFVICSAQSEPQIKAIANSVEAEFKELHGLRPDAVDGVPGSQWVIVDYGNVMLHIFHETKREVFGLEALWGDAHIITPEETTPRAPSPEDSLDAREAKSKKFAMLERSQNHPEERRPRTRRAAGTEAAKPRRARTPMKRAVRPSKPKS